MSYRIIEAKEWYSPGEVIPTVDQLTSFVLPHLDMLRNGDWPVDPRPTGYVGSSSKPNPGRAYFINAAELAAEIDERMSKVLDSIALILFFTAQPPWPIQDIARSLHYPDPIDLEYEMSMMLRYIAGYKRKRDTYPDWKAKRLYKKRYAVSPKD